MAFPIPMYVLPLTPPVGLIIDFVKRYRLYMAAKPSSTWCEDDVIFLLLASPLSLRGLTYLLVKQANSYVLKM